MGNALPEAIIIGSMKSGTTSLAVDLSCLPGFFCPLLKEPEDLCHDEILSDRGVRKYHKIFVDAKPADICFEASTAYTKFPLVSGVPKRAHRVLGGDTKIIYIVRSPLDRAKSHLRHEAIKINAGSNRACASFSLKDFREMRVKEISDYRLQIGKWLEFFNRDKILVVSFEDYVERKVEVVGRIANFITGNKFDPEDLEKLIGDRKVENSSFNRREPTGLVLSFLNGGFYLRFLKPVVGPKIRRMLKSIVSKPVNPKWKLVDFDLDEEMSDLNLTYEEFLEEFVVSNTDAG